MSLAVAGRPLIGRPAAPLDGLAETLAKAAELLTFYRGLGVKFRIRPDSRLGVAAPFKLGGIDVACIRAWKQPLLDLLWGEHLCLSCREVALQMTCPDREGG